MRINYPLTSIHSFILYRISKIIIALMRISNEVYEI